MKKVLICLIICMFIFSGCSTNNIEKESSTNVSFEEVESNGDRPVTKEDVESLYTGENILLYIDQDGKEFVTEDFFITNGRFKGRLVILTPKDLNRKLTFLVNYNKHNIKINGKESYIHDLKLKKGKNIIDIEINDLEEGTSIANIYLSHEKEEIMKNRRTNMIFQSFLLINNRSSKSEANKQCNYNLLKYKVMKQVPNSEINYFVTEKELLSNVEKTNRIKVESGKKLSIPIIADSNILQKDTMFLILCDGIPLEENGKFIFYLNSKENNKLLSSNIKVNVPDEKKNYALNIILIANSFSNNYRERVSFLSSDFILEVN